MNVEPNNLIAGDSLEWTRSVEGYTATEWTGMYALFNASHVYSFTTTDSGDDFSVFVGSDITKLWQAGRYDWTFYLTHKTNPQKRVSIAQGKLTIAPNPATGTPTDGRSHAARMLDIIESIMEGKATRQQLDLLKTAHNGRDFEQNPELLLKWREVYQAEVRREQQAAAIAGGAGNPGARIRVRFGG